MSLHYRAVVQYDAARSLFVASAPELGCTGEGPTRAEALVQLEDALAARIAQLRDEGAPVPDAVDDEPAPAAGEAAAGPLQVAVSASLRRNLAVQARAEGTSLDQLAGELLAEALAARQLGGRRSAVDRRAAAPEPRREPAEGGEQDRDRDRDRRGPPRGPGGGPGRARYQAIMDDKATFLEYVRGLESGNRGGGGAPGGRSGPPRRDRGRGPGGGGGRGDD